LLPRLSAWWLDDPANPGRATMRNPAVQRLRRAVAPHNQATDLGGTMSLNVRLEPASLILRVHQPFISRRRLLALQAVRRHLADGGLLVAPPLTHAGATVLRCGDRWAELEPYLAHRQPPFTPEAYAWLFAAIGRLHVALAGLALSVPQPVVATYASPGSLLRWLAATSHAVAGDTNAAETVTIARNLARRLRARWLPASALPAMLVHGDARLGNIGRNPEGGTVYLDFGFMAVRPRVYELAYAVAFMLLALRGPDGAGPWPWRQVPAMLAAYEAHAPAPLSPAERRALPAYIATVPLYFTATAGLGHDVAARVRASEPFLDLSAWLLGEPAVWR
jgi:Ser/Thr protein kinase RdoA (MazF antagonist)